MYNILSGSDLNRYKPHAKDVSIETSDGTLIGRVAWWSDSPVRDGKHEAIRTIELLDKYHVIACRVVKVEGKEIFRFSTFNLVQWRCEQTPAIHHVKVCHRNGTSIVNLTPKEMKAIERHASPSLPYEQLAEALKAGRFIITADGTVIRPG